MENRYWALSQGGKNKINISFPNPSHSSSYFFINLLDMTLGGLFDPVPLFDART
jgi:hypothetical protein